MRENKLRGKEYLKISKYAKGFFPVGTTFSFEFVIMVYLKD